jgi:Uma2 family endonuclease
MSTLSQRATLDDLMKTEGKAELINGRIVQYMATGMRPSRVAANIFVSLHLHCMQSGRGYAFPDNLGYAVPQLPSGRESFSPDASVYEGPLPVNRMAFIQGPPTFAVEVRSECDYGAAAEAALATKRGDYFAAGTLVVWDVDPVADTVARYTSSAPTSPLVFQHGQIADAEPAVPGWRMSVDAIFTAP